MAEDIADALEIVQRRADRRASGDSYWADYVSTEGVQRAFELVLSRMRALDCSAHDAGSYNKCTADLVRELQRDLEHSRAPQPAKRARSAS